MNAEERKNILAGKSTGKGAGNRGKGTGTGAGKGAAAGKGRQDPLQKLGQELLSWGKTILSSLLIVMVINGVLIASFVVPTASMQNEVMAGDFLFVNRFIYGGSTPQTIPFLNIPLPYLKLPGFRDPEKGDVIVFIYPGARDTTAAREFQYYLKRCVATAGDTIQVRDSRVFINGVQQADPPEVNFDPSRAGLSDFSRGATFPAGSDYTRDEWGPMRVPKEGDILTLNDSTYRIWEYFIRREGREVSRQGSTILIDGKPATTYTVTRDYCFGMGDNRYNSEDSRYWGFIPYENVIGTPLIVYWSWNNINYEADPDGRVEYGLGDKLQRIRWERFFNTIE